MVTIGLDRERLQIGKSPEEIDETLSKLGCSVEADALEINPNRPDLFSQIGVLRALEHYFGIGDFREYKTKRSSHECCAGEVDARPFIVCAVVRNVGFDRGALEEVIDFQELLHQTLGRKRRFAAIGLHDLKHIVFPLHYSTEKEEKSFIPLGENGERSLKQILEEDEKGIEYGHLLKGNEYPILADDEGKVLSFPPIINGSLTTLKEKTRDLFIDVTGMSKKVPEEVLRVLVCELLDRFKGSEVERVKIAYPASEVETPDLDAEKRSINVRSITELTGVEAARDELIKSFEKMGHRASLNGDEIDLMIPCYRSDLLHRNDLVEEFAIGYGYDRIDPILPLVWGSGRKNPLEKLSDRLREVMIGAGFIEVVTTSLSSGSEQFHNMGIKESKGVEILNPISKDTGMVRSWLLPSLLSILRANRHNELPQRVFEIGDMVKSVENRRELSCVIEGSDVDFRMIKSISEGILMRMGIKAEYIPTSHESFIGGRCAFIFIAEKNLGILGEMHPRVLRNFSLSSPVVALEISVDGLHEVRV